MLVESITIKSRCENMSLGHLIARAGRPEWAYFPDPSVKEVSRLDGKDQ